MRPDDRGRAFDALRRGYPHRREFRHTTIALTGGTADQSAMLRAIGFGVAQP
jgi:hypothetical protein